MDTSSCSRIVFIDVCENAFYFEDKGAVTDLDEDSFHRSTKCKEHLIQSKDNKVLLLNAEEQLQACDVTIPRQLSCNFFLQMYNDSNITQWQGRAVILYTNKDNKKMVVWCHDKNKISSVAMEPPSLIENCEHNAVFYSRKLQASNTYTFESSVYLGRFLAFEPDENNPSVKKLVLRPRQADEVDETSEVVLG